MATFTCYCKTDLILLSFSWIPIATTMTIHNPSAYTSKYTVQHEPIANDICVVLDLENDKPVSAVICIQTSLASFFS